ncbi:hypothetical protein V8D89_007069 [Ganoderma adspersum]
MPPRQKYEEECVEGPYMSRAYGGASGYFEGALLALAGLVVLVLGFALNVLSTYVGGRILHYATTPMRTVFNHTVVTSAYARVALAGCALVGAELLLLAPTVTVLVERRHGDDAAEVVC